MSRPVRIGVIGCGYWGPNLLRHFARLGHAELVAAGDIDSRKLNTLKRVYKNLRYFSSGEDLIRRGEVDAVAVATPVSTHYSLAKAALNWGKHVLVEKPVTATVSEAKELIQLARKHRLTLMADHTFVYSGAVRKIHSLIQSGVLGDIYYYDSVRVNLGLFQRDVDVLWDLAPHDFSIMTYLIKKKIHKISAIGSRPIRQGRWKPESIVYVTIQFEDHTLAHFHLNWLSPVKVRRTLIGGSKKMVVYDHLDPDNQVKIFNKGIEVKTDEDRSKVLIQYRTGDMLAPKVDQTEALEHVCRHFVESIRSGKKPETSGESGLEVVRLLKAAEQSLRKKGAFVSL